eukprot:2067510-Pyramimonas_sp.AAC.1
MYQPVGSSRIREMLKNLSFPALPCARGHWESKLTPTGGEKGRDATLQRRLPRGAAACLRT